MSLRRASALFFGAWSSKLFTAHGSTCSEFIYSLRLDHAARLLHRRSSLGTSQSLSEIAYGCGFRDFTHFARKFRQRFGQTPGAYSEVHSPREDRKNSVSPMRIYRG